MASEKVTVLLLQSICATSKMADTGMELGFHGNAFEKAGGV